MKITIHKQNDNGTFRDKEHLVPRDEVDTFIKQNIKYGTYFTVGNMFPDGWYERTYKAG